MSKKEFQKLPVREMYRGKTSFKPLKHKENKTIFTDLDYLIALGKAISEEGDAYKLEHPYIEYHKEGIDAEVQKFAQIIYKGYCDGIPRKDLEEYIKKSINLDA